MAGRLGCIALAALAAATPLLSPAVAAERINIWAGPLERSLAIPDLIAYARSGVVSPALQGYLDLLKPPDRLALRTALNQRVPVNAVEVSNFLSTPLGQLTLAQLVKVLARTEGEAVNALASALILAAEGGSLHLAGVLQAYPLPAIDLNLQAITDLARQLSIRSERELQLYPAMLALGSSTPAPPSEAPLAALAQPGAQRFIRELFAFVGRDGERIEALAYLPDAAPSGVRPPLVVLAPGLNTNLNALLYVGEQLASHGYGVAALNFPFTSGSTITAAINGTGVIPPPNKWLGQPHTVSDLIDQVQQRWGERIDTASVGVLGQSLGGYTATALAGAPLDWAHLQRHCRVVADPARLVLDPAVLWQCQDPGQARRHTDLRDARVKAAVAVNPVTNPIFSSRSMQQLAVPLMMVAGTDDIFAPAARQQLQPFAAINQPQRLLVLQANGTHLSFLDGKARLPGFLMGVDRPLARQQLQGLARAFFDTHLRHINRLEGLLPASPAVGAQQGRDPLPLLLKQQLSPQQLQRTIPWVFDNS
jgi:predicted dienelactone hydrolase